MSLFANSPSISGIWEMRMIHKGTLDSSRPQGGEEIFPPLLSLAPEDLVEYEERGLLAMVEFREVPRECDPEGDRKVVLPAAAEPVGWM
jgi:hypothetical protein